MRLVLLSRSCAFYPGAEIATTSFVEIVDRRKKLDPDLLLAFLRNRLRHDAMVTSISGADKITEQR